jgi:hypothetical protein
MIPLLQVPAAASKIALGSTERRRAQNSITFGDETSQQRNWFD